MITLTDEQYRDFTRRMQTAAPGQAQHVLVDMGVIKPDPADTPGQKLAHSIWYRFVCQGWVPEWAEGRSAIIASLADELDEAIKKGNAR